MPKYNPTKDDLYRINICPVCGNDAINSETCSDLCRQHWESFKKDYECSLLDNIKEEEED